MFGVALRVCMYQSNIRVGIYKAGYTEVNETTFRSAIQRICQNIVAADGPCRYFRFLWIQLMGAIKPFVTVC